MKTFCVYQKDQPEQICTLSEIKIRTKKPLSAQTQQLDTL